MSWTSMGREMSPFRDFSESIDTFPLDELRIPMHACHSGSTSKRTRLRRFP
jgi:hypothetical protein